MRKLDSFIKESHRYNCFDLAGTPRVVKKDFQFKNGLRIPKGTVLLTPNAAMLFDDEFVQKPLEFDGLRFYDLANTSETPEIFRYTSTNPHYLQFGDGRHVWQVNSLILHPRTYQVYRHFLMLPFLFSPGRFFAADELRLILAYLLLNFEIKIQGGLPKDFKIKRHNLPHLGVNILLKKIEEERTDQTTEYSLVVSGTKATNSSTVTLELNIPTFQAQNHVWQALNGLAVKITTVQYPE